MLNDLQTILIQLYSRPEDARRLCQQSGIDTSFIDFGGNMQLVWWAVIREAERRGRLAALVKEAADEYPQRPELQRIWGGLLYVGSRQVDRDAGDVVSDGEKLDEIREMVWEVRERVSVQGVWLLALTVAVIVSGLIIGIKLF